MQTPVPSKTRESFREAGAHVLVYWIQILSLGGAWWRRRLAPKLPRTRRSASVADRRAPTEHALPAAVVRIRGLGWALHQSTRGGARTVGTQTIGVATTCEIEVSDDRGLLAAILPGRPSEVAQGGILLNKRSGNWVYGHAHRITWRLALNLPRYDPSA